jgi:hypothetical protein
MPISLDHVAIAATSLAQGVAWVEDRLGVPMAAGGAHAAMGTHNRLLSLGPSEYLEVIAIDPAAPPPPRARWFGLDRFSGPPRPVAWVLRSDDLEAESWPAAAGPAMALRRGDFTWRITVPDSGLGPFGGLFPALIEWSGPHPAERLPDQGVRLTGLTLCHPEITALAASLPLRDPRLHFVHEAATLRLTLTTPNGDRQL